MEQYLKGVYGELPYDELKAICQTDVPEGEYYDYEKIRSVFLRKLNGEIDDEYFKTWLIVVGWALNEKPYEDIAYAFDGWSFCECFDKKHVLEFMAKWKDYDYKLRHKNYVAQHKKEGKQVVYLRFEHCNWTTDSCIYKAYFVDYSQKRFDIRFVDDAEFDYKDDILYCFLKDSEPLAPSIELPRKTKEEDQLMSYFFNERENWVYDHALTF